MRNCGIIRTYVRSPALLQTAGEWPQGDATMAIILLINGGETIVDDADFAWLSQYHWRLNTCGYAERTNNNKKPKYIRMHRDILQPPNGIGCDHIDGNRLNNQRNNLRLCTQQENTFNSGKRQPASSSQLRSQYIGVHWHQNRWQVRMRIEKEQHYIGRFRDELEAARAYDAAAIALRGQFARLNFPENYRSEARKAA